MKLNLCENCRKSNLQSDTLDFEPSCKGVCMKLTQAILVYILSFVHLSAFAEQKAVINAPIADLIGQQIITLIVDQPAEKSYKNLPVCAGEIKSSIACPRLHQLLYNDMVEIVTTTADEVCIRIPQAYCATQSTSEQHNTYWTLNKNITPLDSLIAHNIAIEHIPQPIDFSDKSNQALNNTEIITLIEPHHDTATKLSFSVGTRFVRAPNKQKKKNTPLTVFAIDFTRMKEHIIKIPSHKCVVTDCTKTNNERITDFITLLKKWCHTKNGHIPYVWGGTSFIKTVHTNFKEVTATGHNGDYSFYEYEKDTQSPKTGFDCSGLILRAAQISGIPYFCKNTTTIAQRLQPLQHNTQLQAGDIILIRGHVMVASDIANNLLIEARSYGHGYGKLHEIPLKQVFDNIETYDDLMHAYFKKIVIKRKDKQGKVRDTFSNLQLFSMKSVFESPSP